MWNYALKDLCVPNLNVYPIDINPGLVFEGEFVSANKGAYILYMYLSREVIFRILPYSGLYIIIFRIDKKNSLASDDDFTGLKSQSVPFFNYSHLLHSYTLNTITYLDYPY